MDVLASAKDVVEHLVQIRLIRQLLTNLLNNLFVDLECNCFTSNSNSQDMATVTVATIIVAISIGAVKIDVDVVERHNPIVVQSIRVVLERNAVDRVAEQVRPASYDSDHHSSLFSVSLTRLSLRFGS
jgi:hypothetical protein